MSRGVRVKEELAESSNDADESMEARQGAADKGSAKKWGQWGRRDVNRSIATMWKGADGASASIREQRREWELWERFKPGKTIVAETRRA